jgi:acid phosphatase family membrane protein YuiD
MTVSLCAMAGYFDGVDSVGFAISVILIVLVLWDAGVLRQIIGKHAGEINRLSHLLPQEEGAAREFLQERIGHRFPEILVGVVVGLFVSAIYILFLA